MKIPLFSKIAFESTKILYDESFAVHAGKLWNILLSLVCGEFTCLKKLTKRISLIPSKFFLETSLVYIQISTLQKDILPKTETV